MGTLTDKQKAAVRDSWAKITASWQTHGPDFFIRLFTAFPTLKTFFKNLDNVNEDQLRKSPKLKAHAVNFKHGVTSLIDNLDDVDCLIILIHKLADNHFRRNVTASQFQDALTLFVEFAKDVSGFDTYTSEAWKDTLKIVTNVFEERMKELALGYDFSQ